jgi:hypothetical protein
VSHVVLLGDSIFDNGAYVEAGEPDVARQLATSLDGRMRVSLQAVDGSTTRDLPGQIANLPADATHLIVSCGGNDALRVSDFLGKPAVSVAEALLGLARLGREFEENYARGLAAVLGRGLPTAVCTIYDPRFSEPQQTVAVAALATFNDIIVRFAVANSLPLVDLRLICSQDADYANPIEPSCMGGAKIGAALARLLTEHDFTCGHTAIYV